MKPEDLNPFLARSGYKWIGGITNRVFLHQSRQEILKLSVDREQASVMYKTADFTKCLEVSRFYAPLGLMPKVYEAGGDYQGTGFPFLREQYIPGENISRAFLKDPSGWEGRLPAALARTYTTILGSGTGRPAADLWQEKLDGMVCPPGHRPLYETIRRSGELLRDRYNAGLRIHGDLQLGNMLTPRTSPGNVLLIDWEMSETMPLGYEFAMLYTFLLDPIGQIEEELEKDYAPRIPLAGIWRGIAAMMREPLGISPEEFVHSVLFRMGNAWLYQLDIAFRRGDNKSAAAKEQVLIRLLNGDFFDVLPYGGPSD